MTHKLEELIRDKIRAEGPIGFDAYMAMALYEPGLGYYASTHGRVGFGGHYLTSPELDPAFGTLWAEALEQVWAACDQPDTFFVTEIGAGEGGFANSILDAAAERPLADALRYRLVEPLEPLRARQERVLGERVSWVQTLDEVEPGPGCLLAHEVLDNVPVKLVRGEPRGALEVLVGEVGGRLAFVEGPSIEVEVPNGHLRELSPARDALISKASGLVEVGAVMFIDYGYDSADDHPDGTVVCYSKAGTDDQPLVAPGSKDITAHVDWSRVHEVLRDHGAKPIGPISQKEVLLKLGISDLDAKLRANYDQALAVGDGARSVRSLSRRQAIRALLDVGGLGGLQVCAGLRDIEAPPFLAE